MGIDAEMLVRVTPPLEPLAVRRLAYRLAEGFGAERFLIDRAKDRHCLEIVQDYTQDGPDITPAEGEQFIRLNLFGRYYGAGYERGDLPFLLAVAEWLESAIPGSKIFYGGDSSGVCAEPFDGPARDALWRHFIENGHRPYSGFFGRREVALSCAFCGGAQMANVGGGRGVAFHVCGGCDFRLLLSADGSTREADREWRPLKEA